MLLLINTVFHYTVQSLKPCLLPYFPIYRLIQKDGLNFVSLYFILELVTNMM